MINLKNLFGNIKKFRYLSSHLQVKKKKQSIFFSIILKNINASFEVVIVILISFILTNEIPTVSYIELIDLNIVATLLPVLVLIRLFFNFLDHQIVEKLIINITASQKKLAAERLFQKENLSFAYINYKVSAESQSIASLYKIFITFIGTGLQLSVFAISIIILDYRIALIIFITSIVLLKPISLLLKKFKINSELNKDYVLDLDRTLERILNNYYLIKILNKEDEELNRFENSIDDLSDVGYTNTKLFFISYNILTTSATFIIALLLVQNIFVINLSLEVIFLLIRSVQFISQMTSIYGNMISQSVFINSYLTDLNQETENKEGLSEVSSNEKAKNIIDIENLSFIYQGASEDLFNNLSLSIEKGTHNIIIGPNGSGKSTLIGIMSGIYKPSYGKIRINTDKFSYVGPDPLIFTDSLRNNLKYGLTKNVSDEILEQEILSFNVFDNFEITDLDKEISSKILSSGQMQKISFIRSILRNPDVLFLDEASSNLDNKSVLILEKKLNKFEGTIINITHKQEHFKNFDFLYEISEKKLHKID